MQAEINNNSNNDDSSRLPGTVLGSNGHLNSGIYYSFLIFFSFTFTFLSFCFNSNINNHLYYYYFYYYSGCPPTNHHHKPTTTHAPQTRHPRDIPNHRANDCPSECQSAHRVLEGVAGGRQCVYCSNRPWTTETACDQSVNESQLLLLNHF